MATELPLEERIVQIFRRFGITQAHVGASMSPDWRGLATRHSDLIASLTLVCPPALDPNDLSALPLRFMVFAGDQGPRPEQLRRSLAEFHDAALVLLPHYLGETWSDGTTAAISPVYAWISGAEAKRGRSPRVRERLRASRTESAEPARRWS